MNPQPSPPPATPLETKENSGGRSVSWGETPLWKRQRHSDDVVPDPLPPPSESLECDTRQLALSSLQKLIETTSDDSPTEHLLVILHVGVALDKKSKALADVVAFWGHFKTNRHVHLHFVTRRPSSKRTHMATHAALCRAGMWPFQGLHMLPVSQRLQSDEGNVQAFLSACESVIPVLTGLRLVAVVKLGGRKDKMSYISVREQVLTLTLAPQLM